MFRAVLVVYNNKNKTNLRNRLVLYSVNSPSVFLIYCAQVVLSALIITLLAWFFLVGLSLCVRDGCIVIIKAQSIPSVPIPPKAFVKC